MSEITEAERRDLIDLHLGVPLTVTPMITLLKAAYDMAVGPGHPTAYDCSYPVLAAATRSWPEHWDAGR